MGKLFVILLRVPMTNPKGGGNIRAKYYVMATDHAHARELITTRHPKIKSAHLDAKEFIGTGIIAYYNVEGGAS